MKLPGVTRLEHFTSIASTQDEAKRLAETGSPEGTLVWADLQTGGRGRMSRRWKSAPGGIYVSLILRPRFPPERLAALSLWTAAAAAQALGRRTGLVCVVKPPNDVLAYERPGIGDRGRGIGKGRNSAPSPIPHPPSPKKVCGILIEARGGASRLDWAVAGVGINVNNHIPAELSRASSLRALAGHSFDGPRVLAEFLESFWETYRTLV